MSSAKIAVVTGASTGIGHCIALSLAETGWDIAFTHIGDVEAAATVEQQIIAAGVRCLARPCDAGVKREVDAFFAEVERWGGAPDLLVNNAGIQTWASLLDLEEESWDRVIRTNLKGCFLNTQTAARLMVQHKKAGAIVNLGSGCNKLAFPMLVDYTASKGGIEQFTKVAAAELGPYGIRVNCVAPGAIENERTKAESGDYAATWSKLTPLRRIGQGEDVAKAVVFLASPAASFITGQTLAVDGGVFSQAPWPY
jgi:NAD(P)-dependent dehydrogenase (short-subunit alcohol dehydrogenase family)